jgi:hypothetical protein
MWELVGRVIEDETGLGLEGVVVEAHQPRSARVGSLGRMTTGRDGRFALLLSDSPAALAKSGGPIHIRVLDSAGQRRLFDSNEAMLWGTPGHEKLELRVPRERLGGEAPARDAVLLGDDDEPTSTVGPGESLRVQLQGLRPATPHRLVVAIDGKERFTELLMSDEKGAIEPTVIWPYIGLEDPDFEAILPIEEALRRWQGRSLEIVVRDKRREVASLGVAVEGEPRRPILAAVDGDGALFPGFEVGKADALLGIHGGPSWERAQAYLVPRQHIWRSGDAIRPVELLSGRPATSTFSLKRGRADVRLAAAEDLRPGAYDFILRRLRYGWEDDDELFLRPDDIVGGRWTTGLVVREEFWASKLIRGGCVNEQRQMVGRQIGIWPYIQYTDVFQVGENIYGALDPSALDPALVSKMVAMYVVPHKTAAQWTADSSLSHLPVLGGNPAVQRWLTQSWCINANFRLLWPNATQIGEYDVVADFGNNTGTPAAFVPDDTFTMPLDLIDGYTDPGFRIVPDPTTDTSFANAGSYTYDETTQGSIAVSGDGGSWTVPVRAIVYFPADAAGATTPGQISAAQPNYPLVVVVHGNSGASTSYLGYNYLLEHLARNGFIAASIHLLPGERGTDRARVLRQHLQILFAQFGTSVANNVGLMGHSRGGEAVVIAARLNQQEGWGYNLNAVVSLAPTNQYTFEHFAPPWAAPYLVIYGSLDGDLGGIGDTGFELYDQSSGLNKSMAFVYRACHDRFNTVWGDGDFYFGQLAPSDIARVLTADSHQKIAKGYMTAFFRQHLGAEGQWAGIFKGEWVPAAVTASDGNMKIYVQYEDTAVATVDNFEGVHTATSWQTSTIGDTVNATGLPSTPQENDLRSLDGQSPHATAGLMLAWDGLGDSVRFDLPAGSRDLSTRAAISFRVGLKVGSASNPAGQPQDFRVTLIDGAGKVRAIRVSKFAEIPFPDVRGYASYTKSAMRTIRIPMSAYTIRCLGIDEVDTTDIRSLTFEFAEKMTGEIALDSVAATA